MAITNEEEYVEALIHRNYLLELHPCFGDYPTDILDDALSVIDAEIECYETKLMMYLA